jgi:steroid delta-isomerase-like uncharacterized protein
MSDDVLHLAEKALVALDAEALASLYADEFLFEDTSSGDLITDKKELIAYFERLFSIPDVSFSDVSFYHVGKKAAGRWTWGGRSVESGQEYQIRGASLFELEGDRIKEEVIYYDPRSAYS